MAKHTARTLGTRAELEKEMKRVRAEKLSVDNEEFITGLVCVAVPVIGRDGRAIAAVAVQAPVARMPLARALGHAPALRRAAGALAEAFS